MVSRFPLPEWLRQSLGTVAVVALVFVLLTAGAGVWPPFVAVESGSMNPNLERGDLVLVAATERYPPDAADDSGVVTRLTSDGSRRLGGEGDVIVFSPPTRDGSPIIHRAMFHVDQGENWHDRANPDALPGGADDCESLSHCPAPHAGYITKGDANNYYDQAVGRTGPVKDEWIRGKAHLAVPWLGHLRLALARLPPVRG